MESLLQSVFLQALAKSILASIWQMGFLFLVYHLFIFLFRIGQAAVKNLLSSIFVLGGFCWFLATLLAQSKQQVTTALVIENSALQNSLLHSFTNHGQWQLLQNWFEYKVNFILPYLAVAYLFILLWFVLKFFLRLQSAQILCKSGITPVHAELQLFFFTLKQSLGISRQVELYLSSRIDIPATVGFLKPVVLLPASAVTMLSPAQLEAVLLHELAHIKRYDYFLNILLSIVETILFFNPFALLLTAIARKERENSCDDVVMAFHQNAAVYAQALLNVEKARIKTPELAIALGNDNKQYLLNRVKRILNLPAEKNKISTRLLVLFFFTFFFALLGWMMKSKQPVQLLTTKTIYSEAAKVSNTVFVKPEAFIRKNDELLSLRDQHRKIRIELKKQKNEDDLFVWNEQQGKEVKFGKIIFDDMPADLLQNIVQPGRHITVPEEMHPLPETDLYYFNADSIDKQFHINEEEKLLIKNRSVSSHPRQLLVTIPRMKMMQNTRLPNNHFNDSIMKKLIELYKMNDYIGESITQIPGYFYDPYHYSLPDNLKKQVQRKKYLSTGKNKLRFQGFTDEARTSRDSLAAKKIGSARTSIYVHDPIPSRTHILQNEQICIVLENNNAYINNIKIRCTDSIFQHQTKIPIKKLEVIRL